MTDTTTDRPAPARGTTPRRKVPAFARYEGTSAWKKDRRRARAYARFKAAQATKTPAS